MSNYFLVIAYRSLAIVHATIAVLVSYDGDLLKSAAYLFAASIYLVISDHYH